MRRATLILMLSVNWPTLAIAAVPAPVQLDIEPKLLRPTEVQATPDTPPLHGPEDFALPGSDLAPLTGKDTGARERAPSPQSPSVAPALEGF
jgi:hypothetical protein